MFAGGCEELDWTLSVLFDAMGAMSSKFNDDARRRPRAPTTSTATASSSPAAPACWCSRSWSTPRRAARKSTPRSSAMARPPTATTWSRRRAKAPSAACGWRWRRSKTKIDYINPHATSTPVGDPPEIEAIREVFGTGDKCPPISATKSLTGHSLGATGVQEAIYSLLMMNNGFICESAQHQRTRSGLRRHADRAQAHRQRRARHRAVELLRLRRHQRDAGVQAARRVNPACCNALRKRCIARICSSPDGSAGRTGRCMSGRSSGACRRCRT